MTCKALWVWRCIIANAIWLGHGEAVAEVQRAAITAGETWANADTATMTINGKDVVFTLTDEANTRSDILTNLADLLNASTIPEFEEVTWANYANTHIQGTADTAGKPFTATNSEDTAGDGTFGDWTVVTTNRGPYSANTADNWSTGAMPVDTNDVIFENSDVDCLYDLNALVAIKPASITIKQSYTGRIGLPRINVDGGTADADKYVEYRSRYLAFIPDSIVNIGEGEGTGSGRIMLTVGSSSAPAVTVFNKGSREETGIPCVLLKGGNNSASLSVLRGDVGLGFFGGETANVSAGFKISYVDNQLGDSSVVCGDGMTFVNIDQSGGTLEFEDNATTFTQTGGEATIRGAATITTLTMDGVFYDYGTGTITTLNVINDGDFDHSRSMEAKTISNVNLFKGAKYRDPNGVLTESAGIDLEQCTLQDVIIEKPANKTVTFSAI